MSRRPRYRWFRTRWGALIVEWTHLIGGGALGVRLDASSHHIGLWIWFWKWDLYVGWFPG